MILDIYKDAFSYSGQDIKVLLKLGLLSFFSFLIIPEFLFIGYEYRVMKVAIDGMIGGNDKLPEFDNFTGMLVDGIKLFLVGIGYMIVPAIVFVIGLAMADLNTTAAMILLFISIILFIVAIFYSILGIPNMIANDGSFKKAFDFKRITEIMKMIGTARFVGFSIGVCLITTIISAIVLFILMFIMSIFGIATAAVNPWAINPVMAAIGIIFTAIFSFIVTPYLGIFTYRAFGLIYGVGE